MAYPKRARAEDANAESRTTASEVVAPTVPEVGVSGVQGGAPRLSQARFFRNYTGQTGYKPIAPTHMPITQVQSQFAELTKALQEGLSKQFENLNAEEKARPFWQGFQQYREWMPALMVRRMLANRMEAQGEVSQWMSWLENMRR